ncbi:MAG: hypothetical protein R3B74_09180 [Nitrospirales bacterium]|nr:hypothetical protein [Nitrospirales bacterium]
MPVFQSGAFFQQCFSVHPLSLCLKLVGLPETLGVFCMNCRMRHRMTVNPLPFSEQHDSGQESQVKGLDGVHACFQAHPDEVRITSVDVERNAVQLRCRPCHQVFTLGIRLFETHQS